MAGDRIVFSSSGWAANLVTSPNHLTKTLRYVLSFLKHECKHVQTMSFLMKGSKKLIFFDDK